MPSKHILPKRLLDALRWPSSRLLRACLITLCAAGALSACDTHATLSDKTPTLEVTDDNAGEPTFDLPRPTVPRGDTGDVQFTDVLAQYQALNTRLDRVASVLQKANAPLCPVVRRDVGFTAHTVRDYPGNLREVAREFLGVGDGLSIRTVRAGSSADKMGLKAGDRLIGINGRRLATGATQQRFYERVRKTAFAGDDVSLTIARGGNTTPETLKTVVLTPETMCGYPVDVFFDENINGHTDGKAVWITSQLMRTMPDDVNLSLIVAHEMAHAIAGHMNNRPRKELELIADRMALVMMARAGLDIDRALDYWEGAPRPYYEQQDRSLTHPSIAERTANLADTSAKIKAARARGQDLDFRLAYDAP